MFFAVLAVAIGCKKDPTDPSDPSDPSGGGGSGTQFTVTFNANGGNGTMQSQTFKLGKQQALNANTFTREGYTFASWNTKADASGTSYTDGQEIIVVQNITLYAQWKKNVANPLNGHEWVDLGLPSGTLWAKTNIDENNPELNQFFAWGATYQQDSYDWCTYEWAECSATQLGKYCNNASYGYSGFIDNLTELLPEDDAATANWGAEWRMPTFVEMYELFTNCSKTLTEEDGVTGALFTAPNGNSIFFPAAGAINGYNYLQNQSGIWTSTLYTDDPSQAIALFFDTQGAEVVAFQRYLGLSVRPVVK